MAALTRVDLFAERAQIIARLGRVGWHANAAPAVVIGLDGTFEIRSATEPCWRREHEVYVEAGCRHELDCKGTLMLVLYLAPGRLDDRQFRRHWRLAPGALLALPAQDAARAWGCALLDGRLPHDLLAPSIDQLSGGPAPRVLCDDTRSDAVARRLLSDPLSPLPMRSRGRPLALSPSRLRHVFHEQTGISLQALRRWQRMRAVGQGLAAGRNLTEAAHELAFTDSAHLSRDFRSSLGLPPSRVFGRASEIVDHARVAGW